MADSDINMPNTGLNTGQGVEDEEIAQLCMGSPSQAGQRARVSRFHMVLAQLADEFDQVSSTLLTEINHLEAQVAALSSDSENQPHHDFEFPIVPLERNTIDNKPRISSRSPQNSGNGALKTRWDEHIEDLQLIRGWTSLPDITKKKSIGEKAGIIRARARWIVQTPAFDAVCSVFIIFNALMMGSAADYAAQNRSDPQKPPAFYRSADRCSTAWFFLELTVRLSSEGPCQFFTGKLWTWNFFDFIVVSSDVLLVVLDYVYISREVDFSFLRILRVLRITRAIRVVRLVRFFKELRMMVLSVLRSGTSLLWSLILFGIIHYIFGIFLMQQANDYKWDKFAGDVTSEITEETRNLQRYWGSISDTLYTLYACMSGGISWLEVADSLRQMNWANGYILCFFVFFCTVVVMNIITGIFVDTAIQSAQSDRDEVIQEQIHSQQSELARLRQAFEQADEDGSATITLAELSHHLEDPLVRANLASIGLEIHEAMGLFKLLDMDCSGHVGIEQFVIGCMRLKGNASSIDLATLMYENKRMVDQHSRFHHYCETRFNEILGATDSLRSQIITPTLASQKPCTGQLFVPCSL